MFVPTVAADEVLQKDNVQQQRVLFLPPKCSLLTCFADGISENVLHSEFPRVRHAPCQQKLFSLTLQSFSAFLEINKSKPLACDLSPPFVPFCNSFARRTGRFSFQQSNFVQQIRTPQSFFLFVLTNFLNSGQSRELVHSVRFTRRSRTEKKEGKKKNRANYTKQNTRHSSLLTQTLAEWSAILPSPEN